MLHTPVAMMSTLLSHELIALNMVLTALPNLPHLLSGFALCSAVARSLHLWIPSTWSCPTSQTTDNRQPTTETQKTKTKPARPYRRECARVGVAHVRQHKAVIP